MLGLHSLPFLSSRGFKPTPADITYKNELQKQHVKDLWILIASVVAVLTVIRFVRFLLATFFSMGTPVPSSSGKESFPEKAEPGRSGKISWRQIFPAFSSGFRIVAFRVSVPLGLGSTASVTELLFIFGYIATMFILLLIDSALLLSFRHLLAHALISTGFDDLVLPR